jgi:hypothetical protein
MEYVLTLVKSTLAYKLPIINFLSNKAPHMRPEFHVCPVTETVDLITHLVRKSEIKKGKHSGPTVYWHSDLELAIPITNVTESFSLDHRHVRHFGGWFLLHVSAGF